MKLVQKLFAAVGVLTMFTACNAGKEHAETAAAMEKKMCACADQACVHGVASEVKAWIEKNKETRVSKDNHDKIEASLKKMVDCAKAKGEPDADKLDDTVPPSE